MGVNAKGLFVGLTNRPVAEPRRDRRSRGLLVRDALTRSDAKAVVEGLGDDLASVYNPFHLLATDGERTFLTVADGERATTRALGPGIHVVCNRDPQDPSSRKVGRIRRALEALDPEQPVERLFAGLVAVLGAHPDPSNPLENPCVHTPEYGTRSSTVLALGEPRWRCWHAEGAPCETKYSNLSRLLDGIR